jgi:hypothetical protein
VREGKEGERREDRESRAGKEIKWREREGKDKMIGGCKEEEGPTPSQLYLLHRNSIPILRPILYQM